MTPDAAPWTWRLLDAAGQPFEESPPRTHTRFDAEAWLGEHWRALAGRGAARAVLLRDGEPVGGPVELRELTL
jgi:hypothetical protein